MALNLQVLPPGQYGWIHYPPLVADGSLAGILALARGLGLRGLLCKYNDSHAVVAGDGSGQRWQEKFRALVPACADAGLLLIPWGYVYPDDREPLAARVAEALRDSAPVNPEQFYILDAEIEFDNSPSPTADALGMLSALNAAAPKAQLLFTSWGWPDQHPRFPWDVFQSGCVGFLPQIYPGLIGTDATTCYNRAFFGNSGLPGIYALRLQPVIPAFDLSDVDALAALAYNGAFPAVTWWVLDRLTDVQAEALARTPYARNHASATRPDLAAVRTALREIIAQAQKAIDALQS